MSQVETASRATRMKYGPRVPNGVSHRRQEKPREVVLAPVQKTEDPADYDAFPWLNIKDGGKEVFDFAWAPSTVPSPKIEDGKDSESNNVISLSEAALRKGIVHGFFDKAKKGVLATAAMFVVAGCGVSAPDSVGGIRMPWAGSEQPVITQTDNQGPAVTTEQTIQQDDVISRYAKYLTSLTFPTEDPDFGWKAHKGGKVEAHYAEFLGAIGNDGVFDPHRDAVSYEERKADDSKFANRYNAGLDFFKKLNAGLGSYPDDDPWVHIRSPKNEIVKFKTLTQEGWKEFFEDHGGEYVPQVTTGTAGAGVSAGTPAQAEPAATAAESRRATSVPASERLPGGLRPWYIKSATDGDPRVSGNYARSAETNSLLQRFFKEQGRQRIEEIGVTTVRNAARFIAERVPGISEQALAAVFKAGEHKIAYRASDGTVKFTSVIVGEKTDELNHQINQDEEVLAFKIIYLDGREAIRLLRVMCIQEFGEEVPVAKVIPLVGPIPTATLGPPPAQERIVPPTPSSIARPVSYPVTPVAPEATPAAQLRAQPLQRIAERIAERFQVPPGSQPLFLKVWDINRNGFCDLDEFRPFAGLPVLFQVVDFSSGRIIDQGLTDGTTIVSGPITPVGQPVVLRELVRPGVKFLYARSSDGRISYDGSVVSISGGSPGFVCNQLEVVLPTATSTSTSSPTPTTIIRGFTPGPTKTGVPTPTATSTATPGINPPVTLGPSPTGIPTPTQAETRTGTSTPTAVVAGTAIPEPARTSTSTATQPPTGTPTIRATATFQSLPSVTATVRLTATFSRL